MSTILFHDPDGGVREIAAEPGTLLTHLIGQGFADMPCGGTGRCGKCRIIASGELSEPSAEENRHLGSSLSRGIRLACQARVEGDVEVFSLGDRSVQTIQGDGMMPVFEPEPIFDRYGAAVDIGTTTLAARLYDHSGNLLSWASSPNPQRVFGADVISRIEKSLAGERERLALCVREAVDALLLNLAREAGISSDRIDMVVLTGNTTMLYLLTARDPFCLSRAPFIADELFGRDLSAEELTLSSVPKARLYLPRCMSAFIGADITTALLASQIWDQHGKSLMADIGTNGELVLWDGERLLCCSTAAGPVFEGAEISQGMQGRVGAIDRVSWEDDHIHCHVIGEKTACGICGSGVIDAVAVLCEHKIIDESGYMEDESYALTPDVTLTRKDIRMVQLAKSAICAGILTLLETAETEPEELVQLAIAGGFGSFLDLGSAARIGLYPSDLKDKAVVLGNAALSGASMILLRKSYMEQSVAMAQQSETIDLTTSPIFTEYYMDCMEF